MVIYCTHKTPSQIFELSGYYRPLLWVPSLKIKITFWEFLTLFPKHGCGNLRKVESLRTFNNGLINSTLHLMCNCSELMLLKKMAFHKMNIFFREIDKLFKGWNVKPPVSQYFFSFQYYKIKYSGRSKQKICARKDGNIIK